MNEEWKNINNINNYQVSNMGRFRSLPREIKVSSSRKKEYRKHMSGKMVHPFKCNSTGYMQIKANGKKYNAHRLVAMAFCPGYSDGLVVNHKNGVRDDNRAVNLEWVTHSENSKHSFRENDRIPPYLGKFSGEHSTSKAVISTDLATGREVFYAAAMDAVREGFDSSSISRCCNGEYYSHKGRLWRFSDASRLEIEWATRWGKS